MSEFKEFKKAMQSQFKLMTDSCDKLFVTDIGKDVIWDTYLESFPAGTNNIYKERREFDCTCCKQFLRPYGNIVSIKDNKLVSIWDIKGLKYPFNVVAEKLSILVKSAPIKNIFVTKLAKLGVDKNRQLIEGQPVRTWEHLYFELPKEYVSRSNKSDESIQGDARDIKNVFARGMEELTIESGNTVLELIDQGSLYRGEEHKRAVTGFISYKSSYDQVPDEEKDNWCWINSIGNPGAKVRNTAIGTLLIDISDGVDLDAAVTKFEKNIMAPANYKRPKGIFTKKMVESAEEKIVELGLSDSLGRRYAVLEDITVNNVLHVNRDSIKKLGGSPFDELKKEVPENIKNFNKVEEVGIEDFMKNIIPHADSIELIMESRLKGNLMSLVAPQSPNAPSMLKWDNNFSWAYNGDVTDSMKQNVKNAGGNVEGIFRFSIQWNDGDNNQNDFDAHCVEPSGNRIHYPKKGQRQVSSGMLDVDIMNPSSQCPNGPAIENIAWTDINRMPEGKYTFLVHNYSHNGGTTGFTAEIEYDGQIYSYAYDRELRQDEKIVVAEVQFSREDGIKFISSLDSSMSSKEIWGVNTNKFSKVSVCMFSPNYWDDQKGTGNKHYLFFLDGCKTEAPPRGFYNEFLNDSLMEHKRVFEALGSKMRVQPSDNQLSGLGFSSTQRNSIIAKIEGSFKRTIKINF